MENSTEIVRLFIMATGFMMLFTLLLSLILAQVHKLFFVAEDNRITSIEELLPHTNCGACGYPGCFAFAEALVKGQTVPSKCSVSPLTQLEKIASFLNVAVGNTEKLIARLACAGADHVARNRVYYDGMETCQAAAQVSGGAKACTWGCLGFGDCKTVCNFNAIKMSEHHLPVVNEQLCTACGDCVKICPKDLFSLQAISHRLWIACRNEEAGDQLLQYCEVACTACARCAMDAADELIVMHNNLPTINYQKPHNTQIPMQRCPTGAIVWLNEDNRILTGTASKKTIRHQPLPATPS